MLEKDLSIFLKDIEAIINKITVTKENKVRYVKSEGKGNIFPKKSKEERI